MPHEDAMEQAESAEAMPFARPKLLRYYAVGIFVLWAVLALAILSFVAGPLLGWPFAALYMFGGFIALTLMHTPMAALLRCPHCGRMVTIQTSLRIHPNAASRNSGWFRGWARIILDAALNRAFVCMHCGRWVEMPGVQGTSKSGPPTGRERAS